MMHSDQQQHQQQHQQPHQQMQQPQQQMQQPQQQMQQPQQHPQQPQQHPQQHPQHSQHQQQHPQHQQQHPQHQQQHPQQLQQQHPQQLQQQHLQQHQQQQPQQHQQQQPLQHLQHPQQHLQQHPQQHQQLQQQQQQHQQQQQGMDFQRGPPMRQTSASSTNITSDYHHATAPTAYDAHGDSFGAKRVRKLVHRRAVDYTSTVVRYTQTRMCQRDTRDRTELQPTPAAAIDMLPTIAYADNPSTSFAAKFVHASTNKNRCSINRVLWTPTGRRLITGSQSGEFTLWNGQSFNFEMILQAHDQAIRSMVWSHNENWMVTGDDGGSIKYWQNNMNNVKANKSAHKESVRDLSFCKTDLKFCSCSDDTTVKVWDFARCQEERSLTGHGWDVKSVDWHPTKSLLVSGGKDNLVKLWDAKTGKELSSFHGHKNTVLCVKWNQNGNWVLTASKDQVIKLYDIRSMKELQSFRGHQKDVTALAWHPFHEEYFVSGSFDGSIFHWLVGHETPQVEIKGAHENSVWDLAWHPIGYILCSGSNDHTTRFWCRNRPGDPARDKSNMGYNQGYGEHNPTLAGRVANNFTVPEGPTTPGPFSGGSRNEGNIPGIGVAMPLSIPSLDTSDQGEHQQYPLPVSMPVGAPPLPPGPHPSLLASGQQSYQQFPHHIPQQQQQQQQHQHQQQQQQHQPFPQQMGSSLQVPPPNMPQMQPPPHLPMLQHPHLPRPPPHHLSGSLPMPSMSTSSQLPMPGPMGMQGPGNQMVPPLPQGHHMMGLNQMHSGSVPNNGLQPPLGSFANGMPNSQGPSGAGAQMYPSIGGAFNRGQPVQMPMVPGLNSYQPGNPSGTGMGTLGPHMSHQAGMPPPPPPPPGPPPHGSNNPQ